MRLIRRIPIWLVFLIPPMLMILPSLGKLHFAAGTEFNDIEISHYPNMLLIQQTMITHNEIPLWNPYILGGYPFDADPLSGLWYPPNWLILLLPILTGINLSLMIHIFLAGTGMYYLMQRLGVGKETAIVIGLLFTSLPKIYGHFGAGHFSYLTAMSLTPWLCYAAFGRSKSSWIVQSLLIGSIMLADIRWLPFGILCWIACIGLRMINEPMGNPRSIFVSAAGWMVCGMILCSGFLFALFQFSQYSTRSTLSVSDVSELALPATRLFTIFLPSLGVSPEWMVYLGMGIPLLAIVGIIRGKQRYTLIWVILAAGCILFSMGSQIPGFNLISQVPGFDMMRVPSRAMFVSCLSILILAGYGLDSFRSESADHKWILWINVIFLISAGRIVWLAIQNKTAGAELWLLPILVLFSVLVILVLKQKKKITFNFLSFCLALFLLMDIGIISRFSFTEKTFENLIPVDVLSTFPKYPTGRVYSPDYAIGQSAGVEKGIAFAEGVHPLQIWKYVNYLSKASGVDSSQYSVVQPPLRTGNPHLDNITAQPNAKMLARLNVSHIISRNPISDNNLKIAYQDSDIWVYENLVFSPFPEIANQHEKVKLLHASPNILEYNITGPGRLSTSDLSYPGWRVTMDGKLLQINTEDDLFRSVEVPAGEHIVRFYYHPTFTLLGISLGVICLLIFTSRVFNKFDE